MSTYGFKSKSSGFIFTDGQACLLSLQSTVLNLLPKQNNTTSLPLKFILLPFKYFSNLKRKVCVISSRHRIYNGKLKIFLGLVSLAPRLIDMELLASLLLKSLPSGIATCKLLPLNHGPSVFASS